MTDSTPPPTSEEALVKVEDAVEGACQAIYTACQGYWPNTSERRRIAIALMWEHLPPRCATPGGATDGK